MHTKYDFSGQPVWDGNWQKVLLKVAHLLEGKFIFSKCLPSQSDNQFKGEANLFYIKQIFKGALIKELTGIYRHQFKLNQVLLS